MYKKLILIRFTNHDDSTILQLNVVCVNKINWIYSGIIPMLCFGSVRPQVISRHGVFCLHVSLHASLSVSDDTMIKITISHNDSFKHCQSFIIITHIHVLFWSNYWLFIFKITRHRHLCFSEDSDWIFWRRRQAIGWNGITRHVPIPAMLLLLCLHEKLYFK